jgi:hypothetical protein
LDGEILSPEVEPTPRIRVEVTHRYQLPQRRSAPPAWITPLVVILFFSMVSPYALIVAIVMGSVLLAADPTIAIALAIYLALVIGIAIHQRWRGHPF